MGGGAWGQGRGRRSWVWSAKGVVRAMQVIGRKYQAGCHSFFTVRRAVCVCARRPTALVLTLTCRPRSRSSGIRRFGSKGRPESVAIGAEKFSNVPLLRLSARPCRLVLSRDISSPVVHRIVRHLLGDRRDRA